MPGTIHVSVLELVGLPSISQSSSLGVKVSMGKQAHEMKNNEETSFTLASLRDNLNVSVRDSEGNEIARTDVQTRLIVEKVTWDDLFLLEGGGKIRMKLHFILNEDELNRIRNMRESATRRKHEDLQKRRHSSADLASASGGSPASLRYPLEYRHKTEGRSVDLSNFQTNKVSAESNVKSLNKAQPGQTKQALPASKSTGSLQKLEAYRHVNERIQGQGTEQQIQTDKKPSGARKSVLSFESSPVKDDSLATDKARETNQLSSNTAVDEPPKAPISKKPVAVNTKPVLSSLEKPSAPEELGNRREKLLPPNNKANEATQLRSNTRENEKNISKIQPTIEDNKEEKNPLKKLHIPFLPEKSTFSLKKLLEALPKRKELPTDLSNGKMRITTFDPFVIEKKWRSKHWKPSQHRAKSRSFHENEHHAIDSWIFLDEMISSCVLSDDKPSVGVDEGCISIREQDNDQEKLTDTSVTQSKTTSKKDSIGTKKSESDRRRPNNTPFVGPIGQAVKIAIMAGFGLLVFRSSQGRKSKDYTPSG